MPKLNWEDFSPDLRAFGLRLADLLTKLDSARLDEHVELLKSAPGGVGDAEHFGDPAVYSLIAYGDPGLRALYRVATSSNLPPHHIARHNAERALVSVARRRADVALSMTWLTHLYLDDSIFAILQDRVRANCENSHVVAMAAELFELVFETILSSEQPEHVGQVLSSIGILFGPGERVEHWAWGLILKNYRQRDAFGLLWDGRHLLPDLSRIILDATPDRPVSVAFFDMNGLKAINDTGGHDAGDNAIEAFLGIISAIPGSRGYRRSGDEAVVVFSSTTIEVAADGVRKMLQMLSSTPIPVAGSEVTLTASCGVVSTSNGSESPKALLDSADHEMYRAKAASKTPIRRSVISMAGADIEIVASYEASNHPSNILEYRTSPLPTRLSTVATDPGPKRL